jgi:hypothetical protein
MRSVLWEYRALIRSSVLPERIEYPDPRFLEIFDNVVFKARDTSNAEWLKFAHESVRNRVQNIALHEELNSSIPPTCTADSKEYMPFTNVIVQGLPNLKNVALYTYAQIYGLHSPSYSTLALSNMCDLLFKKKLESVSLVFGDRLPQDYDLDAKFPECNLGRFTCVQERDLMDSRIEDARARMWCDIRGRTVFTLRRRPD